MQSSHVKQLLLRVKEGKRGLLKRLEKEGMDYSESALAEYEETQVLVSTRISLERLRDEVSLDSTLLLSRFHILSRKLSLKDNLLNERAW